jgi:flagellar biosynthetic protein FlhB
MPPRFVRRSFVAEDSDLEKTESATPRRLEKAREEGQVARSRELSSFALLAAGFLGVWGLAGPIAQHLQAMLRGAFTFDHAYVVDTSRMLLDAGAAGREGFFAAAPVLALTALAALFSPMALGGWLLSTNALQFKPERVNPLTGMGRIFSVHGPIQLVMAIAKTLIVGSIGGLAVWHHKDEILALPGEPMMSAVGHGLSIIAVCCATTVAGMFVIAAIDVPYQLWQFHKKLRMTKEEVRREHRENEGDPQVKSRIRQQQRAMARRRMMAAVPKADVIVTNPTHYAVALQYADGEMRAPKVVAKGVNLVAARIRQLAEEHNVPLLEAPPLARALYHNVDLDREIPGVLYNAVAEVLAWVYQLRRFRQDGGDVPAAPTELDVPAELDKGPVTDDDARAEEEEALTAREAKAARRGNGDGASA